MNVFIGKTPCDACPFTTDIGLRPGRLKSIVEDCQQEDVPFICHKSIYDSKVPLSREEQRAEDDGEEPNKSRIEYNRHVVCRGHYNITKTPGAVVQIAERLGVLKEVSDPTNPYAPEPKTPAPPSKVKKKYLPHPRKKR